MPEMSLSSEPAMERIKRSDLAWGRPRATGRRPRRPTNPWVILGLLMACTLLSFIDRQVLSILVDPIRRDLNISDFQVGLLSGPAFVCFYIVGNLASGWAVDRRDRSLIVAAALTVWSLSTSLCAAANRFATLGLARASVGLGEGALGPAVHSLIADSFSKRRLPLALSLYSISGAMGPGIALLLGGNLLHFAATRLAGLPVLNLLKPWQTTFLIVGIPGLLMAPLVARWIRMPPRAARPRKGEAAGAGEVAAFCRPRWRFIALYIAAIGSLSAMELALLMWTPTLLIRQFGYRADQVGSTFGLMLMLLSAAGALLWGAIATAVARKGRGDAALRTMTVAMMIVVPFAVAGPLMPRAAWVLAAFTPILLCLRAYAGLGHATVQIMTPSRLRGRVAALYLATTSVIGALIGPPIVGALTSFAFADDRSIGLALAIVAGGMGVAGVALLSASWSPYRRALATSLLENEASDRAIP